VSRTRAEVEDLLRRMFDAAVQAALPAQIVPAHLPEPPRGRTVVVGAGKASAAMARAVEEHWTGPLEGLVVTRYGHAVPCERIEIVEAAHPVPDAAGQDAGRRILDMVRGLGEDDLVLALISGGGSALLSAPADGLTLDDKQALTQALLRSGATIHEMNCVRKHLSRVKGGRLAAAAAPARIVSLLISDVAGDDPAVIASGPTVPDPTTLDDAREILKKYGIDQPRAAIAALGEAANETPKPDDVAFARVETRLVATPQASLEAAARIAAEAGIDAHILGDAIEGEARDVAMVMAGIARQVSRHGQPFVPPCVLLSGGETTVTVRGEGRGGRNAEFLLALAVALMGTPGIHAIACDTDGIDGTEDNAGGLVLDDAWERAAELGIRPKALLATNDGYGFLEAIGTLVMSGPTLTNVNDFRAIAIEPPG
jgi:glycerate 2-kinase